MKSYFVYVLKSIEGNHSYTDMSGNPTQRLKEHNSGKTKSTKAYKPWKIIYLEEFSTQDEALTRERYFKSGSGREFIKSIFSKS